MESVAVVHETDTGRRILTLCFSDTANACRGAARAQPEVGSYVLLVDVDLSPAQEPAPGRYTDIGAIVGTGDGDMYSAHGNMGSVVLRSGGKEVVGELRIRDSRLTASGNFVTEVAPMPSKEALRPAGI